jgi:integrase
MAASHLTTAFPPAQSSAHGLLDSSLRFAEAAPSWLERRVGIKPRTRQDYEKYIKALVPFFGELALRDIHIGHFREYQQWRAEHRRPRPGTASASLLLFAALEPTTVSPLKVNQELNTVSQILAHAGLWAGMRDLYEPLPVPYPDPGASPALTLEQEQRLFTLAASRPEWKLVHYVAQLAANTSCSGHELRGLRLADVDLASSPPRIHIRPESAKRRSRIRTIPLIASVSWIMQQLLERAHRLGSCLPSHYLFPLRIGPHIYDPTRQASPSFVTKPWMELKRAAGMPWLHFHGLRHTCMSGMGELGIPRSVRKAIAGHETDQMCDHYDHQEMTVRLQALEARAARRRGPLIAMEPRSPKPEHVPSVIWRKDF